MKTPQTLISLWDNSKDYTKLLDALPKFNREQIRQKARHLGILKTFFICWKEDEIKLLKEVWESTHRAADILHLFPGRNAVAIDRKAYALKLKKTDEVNKIKQEHAAIILTDRNQNIIGEKQSYERSKRLAESCDSRQEFRKKYFSAYAYARINGFLDDICKGMIVGISFSYPQAFLFECMKYIYPNEKILYNDRKTIYPKELDVYIPNLKLAFEYDGRQYHKNKEDDIIKDNICLSNEIILYRIKEKSKIKPEGVIISALEGFGFNCSVINIEEATNRAFSNKISPNTIIEKISKFKTMKEFRKGDRKLYMILKNKNLLDRYCSHLVPDAPPITKENIIECFKTKETKNQIFTDAYAKRCYSKFKRTFCDDKEINEIYGKLKNGKLSSHSSI